jgi:Zn-dependent protease with chaperone function
LVTASYDASDEEADGTRLDPAKHVALCAVVEEVARMVGAPAPDEIWVSADARCFAFEKRDFGVITRRTLVLVLGLPHLLVLTAAELRVIVGHELAHIRQKDTTLAVFFYRFAESLRTYLEASRQAALGWLNPIAWCEWCSQWLFQALIAPVQRRQEIRADCRSAEVFGGDLARRTLIKDWLITSQFATLVEQRLDDSARGKPHDPRSLYQQFIEEWREVSPSGREYLRQRLDELEDESYWDSHPALNSRLRAVGVYPNFGIEDRRPAIGLLGETRELLKDLGDELADDLHLPTSVATAG